MLADCQHQKLVIAHTNLLFHKGEFGKSVVLKHSFQQKWFDS